MRAVHLLAGTGAQPRASSTVHVLHRPRQTTETEATEGGTVRGATAQHRQDQQESPGADHGAAADAQQTQRPGRRHGTRHRQHLPINVLHGTVRSLEDLGEAPGAALRQDIVRVVQAEAGSLAVPGCTGDVHAGVDVIGRRLEERGYLEPLRGRAAEDPHWFENRVLFQPYDRALELIQRQIPRTRTLSFRGFSPGPFPPSTMNAARSIGIPTRAVRVMPGDAGRRHPLPVRWAMPPSLVRLFTVVAQRRLSRPFRTVLDAVAYQLQVQRGTRRLLVPPMVHQHRCLVRSYGPLDLRRLDGPRFAHLELLASVRHRETWSTRGTVALRRRTGLPVASPRVDLGRGYWRCLLAS